MTVVAWSPSAVASSTPVTVTVWALFQLALVNVRVAGDIVSSPVSADVTDKTTSEEGWASKAAVNVAVVPDSFTVANVSENFRTRWPLQLSAT